MKQWLTQSTIHPDRMTPSPPRVGDECAWFVRQFIKTVLQQVHNFKVDVIGGDANAAAYKCYRRQECQDLYNSSVAIMLRDMQREVKTGRPFERRLHIDYHNKKHSLHISSANDLDCCFMAILS